MQKYEELKPQKIRAEMSRREMSKGRKIENFDMAIGAIALQHKMVIVTDNISHLGRIRGIVIENWKTDEPKRR